MYHSSRTIMVVSFVSFLINNMKETCSLVFFSDLHLVTFLSFNESFFSEFRHDSTKSQSLILSYQVNIHVTLTLGCFSWYCAVQTTAFIALLCWNAVPYHAFKIHFKTPVSHLMKQFVDKSVPYIQNPAQTGMLKQPDICLLVVLPYTVPLKMGRAYCNFFTNKWKENCTMPYPH